MKAPEQIEESLLAPCGLNCAFCYRHVSKNPCPGCRARVSEPDKYIRKCVMRACTAEQGLSLCAECGRFPCARVKSFEKRYLSGYGVSPARDGAFAVKNGAEALFERQLKTYTCPDCGGLIDLHYGVCSECKKQYSLGKERSAPEAE